MWKTHGPCPGWKNFIHVYICSESLGKSRPIRISSSLRNLSRVTGWFGMSWWRHTSLEIDRKLGWGGGGCGGYYFSPVCHSVILSETLLITFEQWVLDILVTRPLPWSFTYFFKLDLANIFWTVSFRALKFYTSIPGNMIFPWVQTFLTVWPWPWVWPPFWNL